MNKDDAFLRIILILMAIVLAAFILTLALLFLYILSHLISVELRPLEQLLQGYFMLPHTMWNLKSRIALGGGL